MTDPGTADITYIEPLTVDAMDRIIEKERPDGLLPNLGGQSGLNLASELHRQGILKKYDVKVIGVNVDAIERGEDRIAFKETMNRLGIEIPRSKPAFSVEEAEKIAPLVEGAGADFIEIVSYDAPQILPMLKITKSKVDVPVIVKKGFLRNSCNASACNPSRRSRFVVISNTSSETSWTEIWI